MIKFITRLATCYKAMDGIENPKEASESLKLLESHANVLKVTQGIFDFINEVHKTQKPMISGIELKCIAIANCSENDKPIDLDLVSLWAGIGNSNPINRIKEVIAQRDVYKLMLRKCLDSQAISEMERTEIEITIRAIEMAS
jgi:hypothetical protein